MPSFFTHFFLAAFFFAGAFLAAAFLGAAFFFAGAFFVATRLTPFRSLESDRRLAVFGTTRLVGSVLAINLPNGLGDQGKQFFSVRTIGHAAALSSWSSLRREEQWRPH